MVQWLGPCAVIPKGLDSGPGWGAKSPQTSGRPKRKRRCDVENKGVNELSKE